MKRETYPNINRESKWLGIIEYKTIIIITIFGIIMWNVLGMLVINIITKVYITILIMIPILGVIYSNNSSENISHVLYNVFKYLISCKLYVYRIESNKQLLK